MISVALAASGFPSDRYVFAGYLSKTAGERQDQIRSAKESGQTTVFFESKYRLQATLRDIEREYGSNQLVYIGVELTKMHERHLRGQVGSLYDKLGVQQDVKQETVKGEITLIVPPMSSAWNNSLLADGDSVAAKESKDGSSHNINPAHVIKTLKSRLEVSDKELSELASELLSMPKTQVREYIRLQYERKNPMTKLGRQDKLDL